MAHLAYLTIFVIIAATIFDSKSKLLKKPKSPLKGVITMNRIPKIRPEFNKLRNQYSAKPLIHDRMLSFFAQKYADQVYNETMGTGVITANDCTMGMGELVWSSNDTTLQKSADAMMLDMKMEEANYNFTTLQPEAESARFTQIIWRSTRYYGCGQSGDPALAKKRSPPSTWVVVCYFYPAGNDPTTFADNLCANKKCK